MRRLIRILSALVIPSSSLIAFAQSNGAKPSYEHHWKVDEVICQSTVEGVTYIYGFIDGQWQALEKLEEQDFELLDCDEVYEINPTPVS
jgi:hypothetical protein